MVALLARHSRGDGLPWCGALAAVRKIRVLAAAVPAAAWCAIHWSGPGGWALRMMHLVSSSARMNNDASHLLTAPRETARQRGNSASYTGRAGYGPEHPRRPELAAATAGTHCSRRALHVASISKHEGAGVPVASPSTPLMRHGCPNSAEQKRIRLGEVCPIDDFGPIPRPPV